jgi:hypothetical protein
MQPADVLALLADATQFDALLSRLTDADNEQRRLAEACYARCRAAPSELTAALVRGLRASPRADLRDLSAVLLRKARIAPRVALQSAGGV